MQGDTFRRLKVGRIERHDLPPLVAGAWRRTASLRVADAFYVELAHQLGARVLTVDARLTRVSNLAVLPDGLEG